VLLVEPRFVIVGTGRSGTRYISRLLQAAGIRCGHENWWRLDDQQATRLEGDASWIATFQLDDYRGQIFHQVRDPLKVVNSILYGKKQLLRGGPALEGRIRWIDITGDDRFDALNIAVTWLRKAEQIAAWTWRLEDMDSDLLQHICDRIGHPIDSRLADRALATVAPNTNKHTDGQRITWDDLPPSTVKTEAMTFAKHYGYL
jgi:hypothetical protein